MSTKPKLLVGLGNVGVQYSQTRHNSGFTVLDALAKQLGATWHIKAKFKAIITEAEWGTQKVILAKPATYYNLSGEAAAAIVSFYKLATSDVLVIHDELDLPFGTIRARLSGSDAGNNGIKNLTAHLGSQFARIRIGIANEFLSTTSPDGFVLSSFSPQEQAVLPRIINAAITLASDFVHGDRDFVHTSVKAIQ